ncbi:hypothetical protein [Actinokineospora inagensis]|uniref:hypothetical protein n=1 Tax=Actinokineospora inagensis TaxID=103730 RepID=UPI00041D67C2|nr:hypothetical protein [Actinokineospora inagensis]
MDEVAADTCLCCGQGLPERVGARGGPRLRYCPDGEGRWDDGTFSCKRHGATVVLYRAARGDTATDDPLVVLDQTLTRLRDVLSPVTVALGETTAVVERQGEVVRAETVRVAEAEAHAEAASRAAAEAERLRRDAEAAAVTCRAETDQARVERETSLRAAAEARKTAAEAVAQAATAEQARRDAVLAATDAAKTRDAAGARADTLTDQVTRLTADRDTERAHVLELQGKLAAADDLASRLAQATADRDHLTAGLAVARADTERLTTELADLRDAHTAATRTLHTARHLAALPHSTNHLRALLDSPTPPDGNTLLAEIGTRTLLDQALTGRLTPLPAAELHTPTSTPDPNTTTLRLDPAAPLITRALFRTEVTRMAPRHAATTDPDLTEIRLPHPTARVIDYLATLATALGLTVTATRPVPTRRTPS